MAFIDFTKIAEDAQADKLPTKSIEYPALIQKTEEKGKKYKQIQQSLQEIENLGKN